MKKVLIMLGMLMMGISLFANGTKSNDFDLKDGEKKAILLVSFGTTFPETREKTIGALENEFKESFPEFKVVTAFDEKRFKQNGHKLLESFKNNWQPDFEFHCYYYNIDLFFICVV